MVAVYLQWSSDCYYFSPAKVLSLIQLNKLRGLKGDKRSLADYVEAVRRVGDAEALSVTASSAALCATGLAKEKK